MQVNWRLEDLTKWVIDDDPNLRLTFAHIEGPPGSGKAIKLPRRILDSRRILDHRRTTIIQVLPGFKRNAVVQGQGSWSPDHKLEKDQHQPELKAQTYQETLEYLKIGYREGR
ncbi:hypothetical protein FVEG_15484 [Fusarium verticillioides 7600]|uniref:Uncharacterized protein n=1 Tax=Gibberella moniliformis (strain M3125 / FGSC 7600) TaxID=334819 RepID=W7LU18_GIBM7|nr:hypothetical protein FVEG_15484 [Fusarium verticillioides 7600]EWG42718.1 hypothetical protein FVEG_15484 [Fusarium verticillioides 7600]